MFDSERRPCRHAQVTQPSEHHESLLALMSLPKPLALLEVPHAAIIGHAAIFSTALPGAPVVSVAVRSYNGMAM